MADKTHYELEVYDSCRPDQGAMFYGPYEFEEEAKDAFFWAVYHTLPETYSTGKKIMWDFTITEIVT